jgi:hypothetical protein
MDHSLPHSANNQVLALCYENMVINIGRVGNLCLETKSRALTFATSKNMIQQISGKKVENFERRSVCVTRADVGGR